jgi:transcriptional regulator of NAD metabolism
MDAKERRVAILKKIKESPVPITGSDLAGLFSVSRQVIVQDVAILRAAGENILATPQGYMVPRILLHQPYRRMLACKHHGLQELEEELNTIVDLGGKVVDVIVEHPIYGEYKGNLMLSSPAGVRDFMRRLKEEEAEPLSSLTGGVHLHTVEAEDEEIFDRISKVLEEKGILLQEIL